jgi:DNA helicase II / ATP-dependent DNA helicase PcrA
MRNLESTAFWSGLGVALSPEQQAAIAHVDGPLLVVAGPGSGKTTVITYRVAYLTRVVGIDPSAMLVVTYTKAAADSMKSRTARVAGPMAAARATFGTFHALAYRILRQGDPARRIKILEEEEQLYLIRQLMRQVGLNTDDDTVLEAVSEIARMRAFGEHPATFQPRNITKTDFRRLWEGYQEAKAERCAMDFDDLLSEALELLKARPDILTGYRQRFRYIMVDEFQDTNPVQWELVRLLAAPLHNLCVVGDDDQSIYGWRGASPEFLLSFPREYPKAVRVTLAINHRCPPPIVAAASQLAGHNRHRFEKQIRSAKGQGLPIQLLAPADSLQEAEEIVQLLKRSQVPLADWAVIYRTNQQAHAIAQVLAREEIPYRALGGLPNLYKRWPVQDVLAYLRTAVGDAGAIEQVVNRPTRYISRAVLEEARRVAARSGCDLLTAVGQTGLLKSWQLRPIEELIDHLRRLTVMNAPDAIGYVRRVIGYDEYIQDYASREGGSADDLTGLLAEVERTSPNLPLVSFLAQVESFSSRGTRNGAAEEDAVTLVTCHKAKGLEFPRVIVVGATDKLMPHRGAEDIEEERRLMYVAMTRAIDRVWLSAPRAYEGREVKPSPFIGEALGPEAAAWLAGQGSPAAAPTPAAAPKPEPMVRPVPKPAPKPKMSRNKRYVEPDESDLPPMLEPGTPVMHERHGRGLVESIDPVRRRVTIDFGGQRLSLDLAWCLGSPQFFRVLDA